MTTANHRSTSSAARLLSIGAALLLAACGDATSPLTPGTHATMHVASSAVTATTLGDSLVMDAAVIGANGAPIAGADIHWDLSTTDVLESLGGGRFAVRGEGTVQAAAVWSKDPSVRAVVTFNVDAGLLASACITKSDQSVASAAPKCAQQRVVVSVAQAPLTLDVAPEVVRGAP